EAPFLGRITRHAPDLGGAFVDVGGLALLVRLPAKLRRGRLAEGTRLLVQGVRDAVADKPGRGSTRWHVPGRWLERRGDAGGPDVDESVPPDRRAALARRARALFEDRPIRLRPGAADVADDALLAEAAKLERRLERWMERAATEKPGPLATFEDRIAAVLAAFDIGPDVAVTTRSPHRLDVQKKLRAALETEADLVIESSDDPWATAGVGEAWAAAFAAEVPLSGGRLTIEPTRALIAVDVDRGPRTGAVASVNQAAITALVEAIAVRQLAGQIVVDFLDPGGPDGRRSLQSTLEEALRAVEGHLVALLAGGLAVIERPRRTAALHERHDPVRAAATALLAAAVAEPLAKWRVAADVDAFLLRPAVRTLAEGWLAPSGLTLQAVRDPNLAPASYARA
ncbi:MAG: ribonuclease E/G, partial [Pseudomonadota bacterium]